MVFLSSPWYVLLCFAMSVVNAYNSWDFSRDDMVWRFASGTVPSARQVYDHASSQLSSWAFVDVSQPRSLSGLNPVHAQCGEAQVVVTVKRDLFGTGRLIQVTDLTLGSPGCQPTSYDVAEETVMFAVGLHECGSTLQNPAANVATAVGGILGIIVQKMTPDSLVYSVTLYYRPSLGSNPVIVRTSPAEVPIECHYPRKDNVSSKAIKPTWIPFSSTISAQQRLAFSLRLMNEDWSTESTSNRYQLGEAMHIQADVNAENHVELRLFVDNCVATLSPDGTSSPRYVVVDHHGCLIDGRSDDSSSAFVSPRSRPDSLQFTVDAFRFAGDIGDMIYITCHLKVTAADQPLDLLNKACSFNKAGSSWVPVEGSVDICSCCEAGNCGSLGRRDAFGRGSRGRFQRDAASSRDDPSREEAEADVSIGPVILGVQKTSVHQPQDERRMGQSVHDRFLLTLLGLTIGTALLALASVVLVFLLAGKKQQQSTQL